MTDDVMVPVLLFGLAWAVAVIACYLLAAFIDDTPSRPDRF